MDQEVHVTGTLIWYYYVCKREVWLMARQIAPDEDNPHLDLGRFLQEYSYRRDKKEVSVGSMRFDLMRTADGGVVIGEVKKSSRYERAARMQLAFYLSELRRLGVEAKGQLLFPQEKRREDVELSDELVAELEMAKQDILRVVYLPEPPSPVRLAYCRNCAYREFCWA